LILVKRFVNCGVSTIGNLINRVAVKKLTLLSLLS